MNRPIAAIMVLLAAAGCLSLGARPAPIRYYVLAPGSSAPPVARAEASPRLLLGLGPVRLPEYLDRAQIVTRATPERLEVSGADRWAAPLPTLFTRALAERLRREVPAHVVDWPWAVGTAPDLRISLEVQRFEREADGTAVLEAGWSVHAGAGGAALARGESRLRERAASPDMTASVSALSRAVDALAAEITASVAGLQRTP